MVDRLIDVLVARDGISLDEAQDFIDEAKERVYNGEDPEEILLEEFGLEPDYIFDII
jgi:polyhydroxyalkanoate synthesis regulator phasin